MKNSVLPRQQDASDFVNLNSIISITFLLTVVVMIVHLFKMSEKNNEYFLPTVHHDSTNLVSPVPYDIVFVTRKMVKHGASFIDTLTDMPGVGVHSRFRVCAPGKLQIFNTNGTVTTLIDGSNPTPASLNLIDVNAPDVSYDGTQIIFSGLTAPPPGQAYDTLPRVDLGGWRIYKINVNGTGLTQLTFTDMVIDASQFNSPGNIFYKFYVYSDIDPVWMPDGRICFSSSRSPSISEYGGSKTTNLWVMNNNGTGMHRITSERNGAERPMIDPLTGKIVFARWWRNGRFPIDAMTTQANSAGTGYIRKIGLSSIQSIQSFQPNFIQINTWAAASINPDGTDLKLFAGGRGTGVDFIMYGGSFTSAGNLVSNSFPQSALFGEGGFGGLVTHVRGAGVNLPLAGFSKLQDASNPPAGTPDSLWHYYSANGYASDAHVLPDDRVLFSYAPDYNQDYGLYVMDANGLNKTLVYDVPGTIQLRAKAIHARALAPIITDQVTQVPSLYPPLETGPYDAEGTFTFNCLNVYSNGPVDMDITNGVRIGDAGSIRFFINHQRKRRTSDPELDWPILLSEIPIPPSGAIMNPAVPANQPLFEQLRTPSSAGYKVPVVGYPFPSATAHVAGMNYGRPGVTMTCVGCHRGHSMIPVPVNPADAEFTNLAPGATTTVSSGMGTTKDYLNDRCVMLAYDNGHYWVTKYGYDQNQWARLKFPVSVKIKTVRVYNIPQGGYKNSTLQVTGIQVNLYSDVNRTQLVGTQTINQNISNSGTDVNFNNIVARVVEVKTMGVTGSFGTMLKRTGLAEIEVIASGDINTPRISNNENNSLQCDVYPNPVADFTTLTLHATSDEILNSSIYNTSGAVIFTKEYSVKKDIEIKDQIDLSRQPSGLYILNIKSNSINKVVKILKL